MFSRFFIKIFSFNINITEWIIFIHNSCLNYLLLSYIQIPKNLAQCRVAKLKYNIFLKSLINLIWILQYQESETNKYRESGRHK